MRVCLERDKLVFESAHSKNAVIANQSADWCGNPPVRGEMYRIAPHKMGVSTIFGGNRYLAPFNRGIATTSVRTGLAMTGNLEQSDKHQFAVRMGVDSIRADPFPCHLGVG